MGLVLRDDPPKVIDMTGREWGETASGLQLSVRELKREEAHQIAGISVVMRNTKSQGRVLNIPPWILFYQVEGLGLSLYGHQAVRSGRTAKNIDVTLAPGGAVETEIPLATLYDVTKGGDYRIHVSSRLPDGTALRSNEITIRQAG